MLVDYSAVVVWAMMRKMKIEGRRTRLLRSFSMLHRDSVKPFLDVPTARNMKDVADGLKDEDIDRDADELAAETPKFWQRWRRVCQCRRLRSAS